MPRWKQRWFVWHAIRGNIAGPFRTRAAANRAYGVLLVSHSGEDIMVIREVTDTEEL